MLDTFVREYDHDSVVITVGGSEVETTQLHPFWLMYGEDLADRPVREHLYAPPKDAKLTGRWVDAIDQQPGDVVFLRECRPTKIESVKTKSVHDNVYNFSVDKLNIMLSRCESYVLKNSNST